MRFVIAIVLFVAAFFSIGVGVAQRTIWEGPDHLTSTVEVEGGAPFVVIDGAALNAHPGAQLISIDGSGSDPVFMAYGRADDVRAWITGSPAAEIRVDEETGELVAGDLAVRDGEEEPSEEPTETPTPTPSATATDAPLAAEEAETSAEESENDEPTEEELAAASPVGSDLWIQEFEGEGELVRKVNVPRDVSVIIATDGIAAAPATISVTWPLDNSTPWSGPLIIGGIGALLLGLIALIWALVHARRRHGPRRKTPKTPKMPKPPKPAQLKPAPKRSAITSGDDANARGRRRSFAALPVLLVGALALSACTSQAQNAPAPTPSSTLAPVDELEPPVVTKQQFTRIVQRVASVVADADAAGSAELAATRLAGPALELRTANYTARAADAAVPAVPAFPDGEIRLVLPQQQRDWPRAVFAAIDSSDGAEYGLMFVQESPRAQYQVQYLVRLTQSVPEVAPIELGASRYPTDTKLLAFAPAELSTQYGDVLIKGAASEFAEYFDLTDDFLNEKLGASYKETRKAGQANVLFEYANQTSSAPIIALSANDTGAIVVAEVRESETVKPAETGAAINPKGAVKALSQKQSTTKGLTALYAVQILFYVPPATATDQQVRVLGFADGLVAASEVP